MDEFSPTNLRQQGIMLSYLLSDPDVMEIVRPKIKQDYFEERLRASVRALLTYYDACNRLPPIDILHINPDANCRILNVDKDFAVNELTSFLLSQAYYRAIAESAILHESKDYAGMHKLLDDASEVGQADDSLGLIFGNQIGTIEPPQYLLSPWLIKGTVTAIYGAPESFKSFFALDAALQLATGATELPKMSVCYVAAEGAPGLNLRTEMWLHHHEEELDDKDYVLVTKPPNLTIDASVNAFIKMIKKLQLKLAVHYDLIVIDTLSQCMSGADENSAQDVTRATSNMIRIRRELDTTVIFVHHSGKDASKGMRGSSVIKANTDAVIEIERSGTSFNAVAHVRRQKDGPIGQTIAFSMLPIELPRLAGHELGNSLVLQTGVSSDSGVMTPMKLMKGMKLLRDVVAAIGSGQEMSVRAVNMKMGCADTNFYKTKITEMTPLNCEVVVALPNGVKFKLMRTSTTSPGNGVIKCYK